MASVLLPPTDPAYLSEVVVELVELRIQETVRHRDGLAYVVEVNVFNDVPHASGKGGHDLLVFAEPPEEHLVRAVTVLVTELRNLLSEGPSEAELQLAVERVVQRRRGRDGALEQTHTSGIDTLLGLERPLFNPDLTRAINMEQVAAYLRPLAPSMLVALPDLPEIDLNALGLHQDHSAPISRGPLPQGRLYRPSLFARALSSAARQAELCLAQEGLHAQLEGEIQSIRWADVVGVLIEDEHEAAVFASDGSHIQIGKRVWRHGDTLIQAVRDNVPADRLYKPSALLNSYNDDY